MAVAKVIKMKEEKWSKICKTPRVISAEIHYFRLEAGEWRDRIEKAKEAGCEAIASYIPWLCHESVEGRFDFTGRLDLRAFVELVKELGLYFIARPGPFVMAELKNEGIPHWLYDKYPHLRPVSWEGRKVESAMVTYNHRDFLAEVGKWYDRVGEILGPLLVGRGGNVIAVQLDNEIGMLQWINNTPDLSDFTLARFIDWVTKKRGSEPYGFPLEKSDGTYRLLRSPGEDFSLEFIRDFGQFTREDYREYVQNLKRLATRAGIEGVPYIVNIHGTSEGRGFTFPVGISQLYRACDDEEVFPASDIYLGDLSLRNFQDLYTINEMLAASFGNVYGSMEFECGDGNYGDNYGQRIDPYTLEHKLKLCIAQGNRLINYYLFTGGRNYILDPEPLDGNGRIAFTGEHHGFAAPISPAGTENYTYRFLKEATLSLKPLAKGTGNLSVIHDPLTVAFIPDYFMSEYHYGARSREMVSDLQTHRAGNFWDSFLKALLLLGYRYDVKNIQDGEIDPEGLLILPCARYLDFAIQRKIADHIERGGRLLIYGDLPLFDMTGRACRELVEALGITPGEAYRSSHRHFLSVKPSGLPELATHFARAFKIEGGEELAVIAQKGETCAAKLGKTTVITAHFNCNTGFFGRILEGYGLKPKISMTGDSFGVFPVVSVGDRGERLVYVFNEDNFERRVGLRFEEEPLFGGKELLLRAREVAAEMNYP